MHSMVYYGFVVLLLGTVTLVYHLLLTEYLSMHVPEVTDHSEEKVLAVLSDVFERFIGPLYLVDSNSFKPRSFSNPWKPFFYHIG